MGAPVFRKKKTSIDEKGEPKRIPKQQDERELDLPELCVVASGLPKLPLAPKKLPKSNIWLPRAPKFKAFGYTKTTFLVS